MTRLVLIMGVQRSGTNALFKSLTSDPGVLGVNESPDSAFFQDVLLRPEPELRPQLLAHPGPVVLKPISETTRRSVLSVLDEFVGHDVVVPWIYRDPVNCFHSHVVRWEGFRGRPEAFAAQWSERNRLALEAREQRPDRVLIVRYEDLIGDPAVFRGLREWLGVPGSYLFRADRGAGRAEQPERAQELIDSGTRQTLAALDAARGVVPGGSGALERASARLVGRIGREWGKIRSDS